jgi:lysyl-tRNA synthetase class 2
MSLEEIKRVRLLKLHELKKKKGQVFPIKTNRDLSLSEILGSFSRFSRRRKPFSLAGRITAIRKHGGAIFCDFKDGSLLKSGPAKLQAYLKKDLVGEKEFRLFEETIDVGDFVEFRGTLFLTKKREKSIKISSWTILAKSLRPLPEKWHGLTDTEERFRRRYLDLLMNDEVYFRFILRSRAIFEIRTFLNRNNFIEVETPILQPAAGGALAQPFKTHHNALDIDLFLRVAPELYLKKLLVGGYEKVYELGRNFRNEGIDATHNPEFTMLELYQSYKDANYMMSFIEQMIRTLVKKIFNSQQIKVGEKKISFKDKFSVISFYEVLKRHALINNPEKISLSDWKLKAQQFGIDVDDSDTKAKIADNIFRKICRPRLIQPVFVVGHPVEISPLAKREPTNPNIVDRFQLVIGGFELVNGFSELNDPIDQRGRFDDQERLRERGDREAFERDETFLEALEYGMPPAAGAGLGIDRLMMLFLGVNNIKEVILFPTLRPKSR